jgi:hypothetical protein
MAAVTSHDAPVQADDLARRRERGSVKVTPTGLLLLAVGLAMLAQLAVALFAEVNWDEFYFLSRVLEYQRGELGDLLQTFHVHLFTWLTLLPTDEIGRIVVARLVMLIVEAGTLVLIFRVARTYASPVAALCAVAAYATCSNVVLYGASFRFDPLATFLMMAAVALLVAKPLRWQHTVASGLLVAVGGLITIKSVFFLPVVVAVALQGLAEAQDRRRRFALLAGGAIAACVAFGVLQVLHAMSLQGPHAMDRSEAFLSHSISSMINLGPGPWAGLYLADSVTKNLVLWLGIAAGIGVCGWRLARSGNGRLRAAVLLLFAFPLATILFYRNAFPYFYVFALAPAAVLVAVAVDALAWPAARLTPYVIVMGVLAVVGVARSLPGDQTTQRATLDAVHRIFPSPVAYIDRCSMVADFPKVGFFMSTWGIQTYRAARQPSFADLLRTQRPVFVLANSPALNAALDGANVPEPLSLLPDDAAVLRQNYVHHWGAIWVAGKAFPSVGPTPQPFAIAIPGTYTVESAGPVMIDGRPAFPGAVVNLVQGAHTLRSDGNTSRVVLRWGDHLLVPPDPAPQGALFVGF